MRGRYSALTNLNEFSELKYMVTNPMDRVVCGCQDEADAIDIARIYNAQVESNERIRELEADVQKATKALTEFRARRNLQEDPKHQTHEENSPRRKLTFGSLFAGMRNACGSCTTSQITDILKVGLGLSSAPKSC